MEWVEELLAELEKTSILYFKIEDEKTELEIIRSESEVRVGVFGGGMEGGIEGGMEGGFEGGRGGEVELEEWDIVSPGVGYFEKEKDEEGKPLIKLREKVMPQERLANIRTMNLKHEVYSEREGKLVEILVEEGQVVEYGQPLFRLRKDKKDKKDEKKEAGDF